MYEGRVEFYTDARGEWRWKIVSNNGRIISETSEGYLRRRDAERALEITLNVILTEKTQSERQSIIQEMISYMNPNDIAKVL